METQNKKAFTTKQTVGFTIISIILATTAATLLFASPQDNKEMIHYEAEALRAENVYYESLIEANILRLDVLQAQYDLLSYLETQEQGLR